MAKAITIQKGVNDINVNVTGFPTISIVYSKLAQDIQRQAMIHGLAQKLGDAAAKKRDEITGKPAPLSEKYDAIKAVMDNLLAGRWNMAAGGVSNHAITPERITVLARMFGKSEADITVWCKNRTEAQLAAAFTSPKFVLELATYRAERSTDDSDDVFEGLDEESLAD